MTNAVSSKLNDLLDCPICKGISFIEYDGKIFLGQHYDNYPKNHNHGYKIRCSKCGCQTCWWHTKEEAITKWNTRAI